MNPPVLDGDPDLSAPVVHTGDVPGTWIAPTGLPPASEVGATIYVHGGGFEHSNPPMERIMAFRLAEATGRPAFAADYRLAPAHPFPAGMEDVVSAYRSLVEQGIPADRILLVGESAGATLVLSAALTLKDAGDATPGGIISVSPITDFSSSSTAAHKEKGRDSIDPSILGPIATKYLAGAPMDQAPQSPVFGDLAGLPPILLAVGGDEILLEDVRRFAELAVRAGVSVTFDVYADMPHIFHGAVMFPDSERLPTGKAFLGRVGSWAHDQISSQLSH
jgi:virginiamycin B lyase